MSQNSLLKKIAGLIRPGGTRLRVFLEVRPDGIAWAVSPGSSDQRFGFAECTPAKREDVLRGLIEQQRWNGAVATLVLPTEQYQVFQMERPEGVDDAELADALRWRLGDLLDFSPSEAISDVFPFPADASRGRAGLVNVVVARKSLLEGLLGLVRRSGLEPERIDIAELALRNLVARLDTEVRGAALVHLRENYGQIVVCRGPTLYLSRRLDVAAAGLRDVSAQEQTVQTLALEIQRSLDYFESQMGQAPPSRIDLVASDGALPLASMLSSYLYSDVENVDWSVFELERVPDSRCLPAWSAGLSIAGEVTR